MTRPTTAIVTADAGLAHDTGAGHPEKIERLQKVMAALQARFGSDPNVMWTEAKAAAPALIATGHTQSYLDKVIDADKRCAETGERVKLDEDTIIGPGSYKAALYAVGAVTDAVDLVASGQVRNAFCAIRPPGHHALKNSSMGFCVFGNVALGAIYALDKGYANRVAIVDFDVHQGNGTQDMVQHDPRILLFSTHQGDIWPFEDSGPQRGEADNIRNFPLPKQMPVADYRALVENEILPELEAFKPDMVFISAGFDAHEDDPPGEALFNDAPGRQLLREADFNWFTEELMKIADKYGKGRVVSVLEGGYNIDVLAACCAAHVGVLASAGA